MYCSERDIKETSVRLVVVCYKHTVVTNCLLHLSIKSSWYQSKWKRSTCMMDVSSDLLGLVAQTVIRGHPPMRVIFLSVSCWKNIRGELLIIVGRGEPGSDFKVTFFLAKEELAFCPPSQRSCIGAYFVSFSYCSRRGVLVYPCRTPLGRGRGLGR